MVAMTKKTDIKTIPWGSQLAALALVVVIGSAIAYYARSFPDKTVSVFSGVSSITFQQLAALALLAGLTVIYLAYIRAKLFFSTPWLVASVIFTSLILFVKFTLSTNELASQSLKGFGPTLWTALLISLLYVFAFSLLYVFFDGRLLNKSLHKALIVSNEGKLLLAMGLFVCATLARIIIFHLPLLSSSTASSYLGDIFESNTALLSGLLFIMIIAAVESFAQVRRRADLKYFFVSGFVLILSFHLWWAIYAYRGY
jgi:hypothetical protein